MSMIALDHLTKTFGRERAVDDLTLTVKEGSIFGLIGSNGSGKSTALRMIAGIYAPDRGQVTLSDAPVFDHERAKEQIFIICDQPFIQAGENLEDLAHFYSHIYPGFSWDDYEELCQVFDMERKKPINTFSKGIRKLAMIIIALSCNPQVLLMDESFDGLDMVVRAAVKKLLIDRVARQEMTVVATSHNLYEIEELCDHVAIIHKGRLILERDLDALKEEFVRVQTAFREPLPDDALAGIEVISRESRGSLLTLIVKAGFSELKERLEPYGPLFLENLPLTLEEIFIKEMEAVGYDYKNITF
ncbi:ABC transporter ATP-binding protein [Zongyangia hominis]|uniref:ABC transporter ATP-binding protein n=1 Tax=Zongyangia hominis TaxID=2763677 RepID=A0A926ED08_9FIRM|nr:ABC transporter ATP-binding protein [Zongyangia hominis]MBC8570820.1 ABC transporter ATP-binding protein [Zongyangia hominis]